MKNSTRLRQALSERRAVIVPGCHDALSAKVIESCAFEAIQISGFGVAGSLLGKPDVARRRWRPRRRSAGLLLQLMLFPVMMQVPAE